MQGYEAGAKHFGFDNAENYRKALMESQTVNFSSTQAAFDAAVHNPQFKAQGSSVMSAWRTSRGTVDLFDKNGIYKGTKSIVDALADNKYLPTEIRDKISNSNPNVSDYVPSLQGAAWSSTLTLNNGDMIQVNVLNDNLTSRFGLYSKVRELANRPYVKPETPFTHNGQDYLYVRGKNAHGQIEHQIVRVHEKNGKKILGVSSPNNLLMEALDLTGNLFYDQAAPRSETIPTDTSGYFDYYDITGY